jgi:hypothetical protein
MWDASAKRDKKRFYALLAATMLIPIFTILTQGFLGFGVWYAIVVLSFVVMVYRRPLRLILAGSVLGFLALSFFVNYMRDRVEIRKEVWGGSSYETRVERLWESFQNFEWFNLRDNRQLERIDCRLNQNFLVGAAVSHLGFTRRFAHGETVWMAVLAFIPRAVWPDKPVSVGSMDLVSTYTGMLFAHGTSVGMGYIFEFYANFGRWGVCVGLAMIGVLVGIADRKSGAALRLGSPFDFAMWFMIGIMLQRSEASLIEVAPGVLLAVLLTIGVKHTLGSHFAAEVSEPISEHPVDSAGV